MQTNSNMIVNRGYWLKLVLYTGKEGNEKKKKKEKRTQEETKFVYQKSKIIE